VVEGMPVLKNTANTTKDARPHSNSNTINTRISIAMLGKCASQQVMDDPSVGVMPASRRRLTSYKPMARNGPTSKQPEAIVMVYSGLLRNTALKITAMMVKATP